MAARAPTLDEIHAARERIAGDVMRTPLVRLEHDGGAEVYLKLENLQPIGSFKLRGAGNGTIGLEILEDLPGVDAIVIPYGGGGLTCGIASAVRALRPATKIYACEVETAAPLAPSLAAGAPQRIEYRASFVDGMGSPFVLEDMWPLVRELVDGSIVVSLDAVASAIRLLAERHHVVAEGAGAAAI